MAQLQHMDAQLDTLSTELYQVNICVGHIARWQATMGCFAPEPTLSPPHLVASDSDAEDDDNDDGDDDGTSDDDGGALPMRCLLNTLPFVTRDKKGEQFWI